MNNLLKNEWYSKEVYEKILSDFWLLTDKKNNIYKKENNYTFYFFTEHSLKDNYEWYTIFYQWAIDSLLKINEWFWEKEKMMKLNKYMIIENKSLDIEEYVDYLVSNKIIIPEEFEFSLWFNVEKNKDELIQLYRGSKTFEWFMPNYIWEQRSWKWISMKFIYRQLALNPMTEFIIVDKWNDFDIIYSEKKYVSDKS